MPDIHQDLMPILKMAGIFAALWIGRKVFKQFGPAILMFGRKPWK